MQLTSSETRVSSAPSTQRRRRTETLSYLVGGGVIVPFMRSQMWDSSMLLQVGGPAKEDDEIEGYGTRQRPRMITDLIVMLQQYSMTL